MSNHKGALTLHQSKPAAKSKKTFWKKKVSENATTVIGKGLSIEGGIIKGSGNLIVDGYFVGNIDIVGDVSIGKDGAVYGNINASNASISGNCKGEITTSAKVSLSSTAIVEGFITSKAIEIEENASFNGKCEMEAAIQLPMPEVYAELAEPVQSR